MIFSLNPALFSVFHIFPITQDKNPQCIFDSFLWVPISNLKAIPSKHMWKNKTKQKKARFQSCPLTVLSKAARRKLSSVQWLSHVQLFVTPWTAACQASLSITSSWSSLRLTSIESVMPFNHLILCHPLLFLSSIFPSIRVLSRVNSSHEVAKVLEFQLQHQSFQWIFRTHFL